MPKESATRLVNFLEDQAGEYLRGAIHYSTDEYVSLYMRDDVDALYSSEEIQKLAEYYRQENQGRAGGEQFELGTNHCTVNFYDDAILFHFSQGDEIGTVITLEPEADRNIVEFITECLRQLHHNSPQQIAEAPDWLNDWTSRSMR